MIESIAGIIFTFGIIIFIHELGHFIVLKVLGVYVEEFSFGFGKAILQKIKSGTVYSIRLIPLGGYVKPKGEDINDYKGENDEYFSKKWYERIMIVIAGPVMNYILSFLIFFTVIFWVGKPVPSSKAIIGDVAEGFPADLAGLKSGDRIVGIDGKKIDTWKDMMNMISPKIEKEIVLEYERDGKIYSIRIVTRRDPASERGVIGIVPYTEYKRVSFFEAIKMSFAQIIYWTSMTIKTIALSIYRRQKPDIAGPIGIVQIVSKAAQSGFWDFLFLVGLISIAVGFFNLLPLPLLDGGHLVMYIFEGVSGKRLTPRIIKYVTSVGIVILASILVFATYSDITRIYKHHKIKLQSNEAAK